MADRVLRSSARFSTQAYHVLTNPSVYSLRAGSAEHAKVLEDLKAEASLLSLLHHDRIVSFRGICVDSGTKLPKYVITELAADSLKGYLTKLRRPLALDELKCFGKDILEGLCYLHTFGSKGIIHRDLKPENILVFFVHGTPVLKIADVGLARFMATTRCVRPGAVMCCVAFRLRERQTAAFPRRCRLHSYSN